MLAHTDFSKSYSSGKKDRVWKNHKWISRKRNKDGKWIYDYGNGFADEVQDAWDEEKSKRAFDDMTNKGKAFADSIGKWLETTEVGKIAHDMGPHNDGLRSEVGKFIKNLKLPQIKL